MRILVVTLCGVPLASTVRLRVALIRPPSVPGVGSSKDLEKALGPFGAQVDVCLITVICGAQNVPPLIPETWFIMLGMNINLKFLHVDINFTKILMMMRQIRAIQSN